MQPKTDKYSVKYFPDTILNYRKHGNYFYFDTSETILEVRVQSDKIIRFRYAADGFFEKDFSYAVQEHIQDNIINLDFVEYDDCFEIITSCITCQINKQDCKIKMFDNDSNLILDDELGFHWQHYLWKGGKIVYCSKKIQEGEPNLLDLLKSGSVSLMINTPSKGLEASAESARIRRACIESGVPIVTSIDTAGALARAIEIYQTPSRASCLRLEEYFEGSLVQP